MRRLLVVVGLLAGGLGLLLTAAPVSAGGSPFHPHRDRYQPGELVTVVGYTGGGQLGWLDDGPFYGYLRTDPAAAERYLAQRPDSDEILTPFDRPLGPLVLQETGRGGYLTLRAAITFTVPRDLAPGTYGFEYCNDPCTTGLGDLVGGAVYVGVDPPHPITRYWPADDPAHQGAPATVPLPPPPPTTTAPPATATTAPRSPAEPALAAAPVSSGDDGATSRWVPVGIGALLLVFVTTVVLRWRQRRIEAEAMSVPPVGGDDAAVAQRAKELLHG